ncbi:MAG: hypothetical protein HY332_13625 [Chloroflexi bacterium]|nr:hypothetical protein [Chloroflexota bacterium]
MPSTPARSVPATASKSTCPKSTSGKARSSRNALAHGLRSALPVIPGLENERDWARHHAGLRRSLQPQGDLETLLADRVALILWRLRRVIRYETQSAAPDAGRTEWSFLTSRFVTPAEYRAELSAALAETQSRVELLECFTAQPDDDFLDVESAVGLVKAIHRRTTAFPLGEFAFPGIAPGTPLEDHLPWTAGLVRSGAALTSARVGESARAAVRRTGQRRRVRRSPDPSTALRNSSLSAAYRL